MSDATHIAAGDEVEDWLIQYDPSLGDGEDHLRSGDPDDSDDSDFPSLLNALRWGRRCDANEAWMGPAGIARSRAVANVHRDGLVRTRAAARLHEESIGQLLTWDEAAAIVDAHPELIRDPGDYPHLQAMCDAWRNGGAV